MVLYRKYRPQTLEDLIGQDETKKALLGAYTNNKLSHAYLFVGPHGTGKTSTARILAKMINCKEKDPPCNKCEICLSITDGSNLDLIEIDAASNRGIDDVRSLRENIKLSPSGKGKKIYIIDEVHMLTQEAFNALLKTLEEPPAHVIFILATTEVHKIPATILSRVTRLDFKMGKYADIIKALDIVIKAEGIKIEQEALNLLAKKADGSFRDGLKLLDQLAMVKSKISVKDVSDGLAVASSEGILTILDSLSKKNSSEALTALNAQIEGGAGVKEITLQIMEALRDLVLVKNGLTLEGKNYGELDFSMNDLVDILERLQESYEKLKFASIPSLPLELAIIEVCDRSLENIQSSKSLRSEDVNIPVAPSLPKAENKKPESNNNSPDVEKIEEKWTFILETIRPYNFSLEALLRSTKIKSADSGLVILEVPYSFHQRILESPKSKDLLESVISEVLQKPTKVTTTLGIRSQRIEDVANVEVAADDEIITLAADIFNGKLVD